MRRGLGSSAAALAILCGLTAAGCREGPAPRRLIDGGRFELPDSGFFYDARVFVTQDAAAPDTGPFVCAGGCAMGEVCACVEGRTRDCGCHAPGGYSDFCDPQVAESCGWPYVCARARRVDGLRFVCTDGREGSSCSSVDSMCRTSNGCVCLTTPLGVACSCQGVPGPNPLLCDPNVPASCPGGSCVAVQGSGGVTNICSQGRRYEPCVAGDATCHTSLGCICPLIEGREVCQCGEPGTERGEPCDPRLLGSCADPLRCELVTSETPGALSTQCVGAGGADGGTLLPCDPLRPFCPMSYVCDEVRPGVYACVPR